MVVAARRSCSFTAVAKWKLFFVLLLPLIVCFDSEVTLVKTIGSKPDFTPICSNSTQSNDTIQLIVCKIRTERSSRNECRLLYRYGEDFVHECDPRFILITKNQTVFLHLTNLTSEDSGNYTCQCSDPEGTLILHLNITVKDDVSDDVSDDFPNDFSEDKDRNSSTPKKMTFLLIVLATVMIITVVIFGFIYRSLRRRQQPEPLSSHPNREPEDIEPYSTFIQKENGLYSTVRLNVSHTSHMSTKEPQSVYYN